MNPHELGSLAMKGYYRERGKWLIFCKENEICVYVNILIRKYSRKFLVCPIVLWYSLVRPLDAKFEGCHIANYVHEHAQQRTERHSLGNKMNKFMQDKELYLGSGTCDMSY